jgi:4-hydroxyproline epimerase
VKRIEVIDSHTGGEPTRVVVSGGPDLGSGTLAQRAQRLVTLRDRWRSAIVNEPRGSDALVGALLCEPDAPECVAGVIFFNNVGALKMCGHGIIGVVATLAHLGRIEPGLHRIATPAGAVTAELHGDGRVSVANVPSYRHAHGVRVDVQGHGPVVGDVAWGGNWFFLVRDHGQRLTLDNVGTLTEFCWRVREALTQRGITGAEDGEIDHIELFAPSPTPRMDARSFVLCPGKAYDRSPCGTGTSAKLACLHADGELAPGAAWWQESITGSVFEASYTLGPGGPGVVHPRITGIAYVVAEGALLLDPRDPLRWGLRPE